MLRAALGIFVVVALAATAHAQPGNTPPGGSPPQQPPPPAAYVPPAPMPAPVGATRTDRYTMSIVATDALAGGLVMVGALVLVSGGLGGDDGAVEIGAALMIGGVGVYAFGPAYVHSRHHNNSSAWKSVLLRLGLPALGGAVGNLMHKNSDCVDVDCSSEGDVAGQLGGIGMLAAMVIDWAVLAKVEVPVQPYYPSPYAAPMAGGGATFGVTGAF